MPRRYVCLVVVVLLGACASPDRSPVMPSTNVVYYDLVQGGHPHVMYAPSSNRHAALPAGGPSSLDLVLHNGPVATQFATTAIYWGPQWGTNPFTGDKETGITSLLQGLNGSNFLTHLLEYYTFGLPTTDMTRTLTYQQSFTDHSTPPSGDLTNSPGTVGAEVCNVLSANHVTPGTAFYLVYSTTPVPGTVCGWHHFGSCGSTPIEYAYMLNMDNSPCASLVPQVGGHSIGLSGLANTTAHELAEMMTDPDASAWYAPSLGASGEISDLCGFTFHATSTTLSNGAVFGLQDLWSNEANDAGYGFAGPDGGQGCQPAPPSSHVVAWISGGPDPFQATLRQYCTWTASAASGTAPYTYAWRASGSNLLYTTGSGPTFIENSFSPVNYTLTLTVTDAHGQQYSLTRTVEVVSFPVGFCSTNP
jgi:hypothetical protein